MAVDYLTAPADQQISISQHPPSEGAGRHHHKQHTNATHKIAANYPPYFSMPVTTRQQCSCRPPANLPRAICNIRPPYPRVSMFVSHATVAMSFKCPCSSNGTSQQTKPKWVTTRAIHVVALCAQLISARQVSPVRLESF
jgi:hypothetical protein